MASSTITKTLRVVKETKELTPNTVSGTTRTYLNTGVPLTTPLISAYSTDRVGWLFVSTFERGINYWVLEAASGNTLDGTYTIALSYLE